MVEGGIGETGDEGIGRSLSDRVREEIVRRVGERIGGGIDERADEGIGRRFGDKADEEVGGRVNREIVEGSVIQMKVTSLDMREEVGEGSWGLVRQC